MLAALRGCGRFLRPALFLALLCDTHALANNAATTRSATTEDLLNSLVWNTDRDELRSIHGALDERHRSGGLDFSDSDAAVDRIVTALAEAASSPLTRGPGQNLRENGCRVVRVYCSRAIAWRVESQALDVAQLDRLVVAVTDLWQRKPESAKEDLKMLLAIASQQPLSGIAADMLVDLALGEKGASVTELRRLLRNVIVRAALEQGLPAGAQSTLLNKLTRAGSDTQIEEFHTVFGIDANGTPDVDLRAERLMRWFNSERAAVGESIAIELTKNADRYIEDSRYRTAFLAVQGSIAANRFAPYCKALQALPRATNTTDLELIELAHIAVAHAGPCGSSLLNGINQHLSYRARLDQAIPSAALQDIVVPLIDEYSADLPADELAMNTAAISIAGWLAMYETFSPLTINRLISWFGGRASGAAALERITENQGLGIDETRRLVSIALDPDGEQAGSKMRTMERIMAVSKLPNEIYDYLGEWAMQPENYARRGVALDWLAAAWRNDKMLSSDAGEYALVYHADYFSNASFLQPLAATQRDEVLQDRLANVVIAERRVDIFGLLESQQLPPPIIKKLAPLLQSDEKGLALRAARLQRELHAAGGEEGIDWLIETAADATQPMVLRVSNIEALHPHVDKAEVQNALLAHLDSESADIRHAALVSLRSSGITQARLSAATQDDDSRVQREAWSQLSRSYDVDMPYKVRWRLYPSSLRADIAGVLILVAMASGIVGIASFLIAAAVSSGVIQIVFVLLGGATVTFVGFIVFFIPIIASQHGNGTASFIEVWGLYLGFYWVCILLAWRHIRNGRQRLAAIEAEHAGADHA